MSGTPNYHDEHELDLPSDSVREIVPAAALEWIDPAMEAEHSSVLELNTEATSCEDGILGPSDSSPAMGSGLRASMPIEPDWAPNMEFSSADIF